MKTIVILLDSVNRRFLHSYGNNWVSTPNIDRISEKATVFDNHWTGSAPCMPARRDMFTGRLNFLERNWGGIEPFDYTLPEVLRDNNIYNHITTDHFHYLEIGGENYCQKFDTWECFRGQEYDHWKSIINVKKNDNSYLGKYSPYFEANKKSYEWEYSTPKTLKTAAKWLEDNKDNDNYFLWAEGFDPHEPFDIPQEYLDIYDDNYDGLKYIWPDYDVVNVDEEAIKHINKRYAALLTMSDHYIGKILDVMDKYDMWKDTSLIFTTDHGYMLGEHNYMAKNYMPAYNEVFHLPLMIYNPYIKNPPKRINALTQSIDIFPTILESYNINPYNLVNSIHGKSILPLMDNSKESIHDCLIYGYFGKNINITDGKYTYFRACTNKKNEPLYIYTAMPTTIHQYFGITSITDVNKIEIGRFLPWTDYPVYKIPADTVILSDRTQSFDKISPHINQNMLFDIQNDYEQMNNITNAELNDYYKNLLIKTLKKYDCPSEQFVRMCLE